MDIKVLGLDLGKTVCSLAGLAEAGAVVFGKGLQRHRLLDVLDRLAACRDLPRHQAEPCGKIKTFAKGTAGADSCYERCRECWTDTRDLHQPLHMPPSWPVP